MKIRLSCSLMGKGEGSVEKGEGGVAADGDLSRRGRRGKRGDGRVVQHVTNESRGTVTGVGGDSYSPGPGPVPAHESQKVPLPLTLQL